MKLGFVILFARDLAPMLAFYKDAVGFRAGAEYPEWVEFDTGAAKLALHKAGPDDPETRGVGLFFTVDDVDALVRRLAQRGLEPQTPPVDQDFGFRTVAYTDPLGNRVEFGEPLAP
ncbi:glyoxalase superfamily protein [Oceanithermus sp.]|uniref:VOC family protein n=1 Tax=Oceanithermus sp. TaxID=2268145 RepID=UPI00257F77AA|nr:glyoxalase superfamily protein [Oceanithermus sp.]